MLLLQNLYIRTCAPVLFVIDLLERFTGDFISIQNYYSLYASVDLAVVGVKFWDQRF